MIIFFTFPMWILFVIVLFCIVGASELIGRIIVFLTAYGWLILLALLGIFVWALLKIKEKQDRKQMIAFGIGMLPLFVYMGLTLPILAELAIEGKIFRLFFYCIGYVFDLALYAVLGLWIPALTDRGEWRGHTKNIVLTAVWSLGVILFYRFLVY